MCDCFSAGSTKLHHMHPPEIIEVICVLYKICNDFNGIKIPGVLEILTKTAIFNMIKVSSKVPL